MLTAVLFTVVLPGVVTVGMEALVPSAAVTGGAGDPPVEVGPPCSRAHVSVGACLGCAGELRVLEAQAEGVQAPLSKVCERRWPSPDAAGVHTNWKMASTLRGGTPGTDAPAPAEASKPGEVV